MLLISLLMILTAYLLGSVSSAILVCKLAKLPDPRHFGSYNPGATNVLRLGSKKHALSVLIFDLLKGMLPVWFSYYLGISPFYLGLIGIAACLGHIYPLYFHFKGGKGVATALGTLIPIGLDLTGLLITTWLITLFISGYSSLAALVTALIAPLCTFYVKPEYTLPVSMLSCLIIFRHHENISRLLNQQENRFGKSRRRPK